MAHTKGPWSVIEAQRGFIVTAIDGVYDIAVVRNMGNEDNKANSSLIAAAPDLLEELEHMLYIFDRGLEAGTIGRETCEKARAAISKATE